MSQNKDLSTACTLLEWVVYGMLLFAAVWWLAAPSMLDQPASLLLDTIVWPIDGSHDTLSRDTRFLSAVGSGLMVSLACFLLWVSIPELRHGNFRVLRGTVLSILAWYLVDSAGSVLSGVSSNVFFNSVFLAMLLYPLWLASRSRANQS